MDIESSISIDLLVVKSGDRYVCTKCFRVLVTIVPGGLLGDKLNLLDKLVIYDHHEAKHDAMRQVKLDPRFVWGP